MAATDSTKVGSVAYAGIEVPIMYHKKNHDFSGRWLTQTWSAATQAEAEKATLTGLQALCAITWTPVIRVRNISDKPPTHGQSGYRAGLDFMRFYVAPTPKGYIQVEWRLMDPDRPEVAIEHSQPFFWNPERQGGPFTPPVQEKKEYIADRYTNYYLPYSEALWAGLLQVVAALLAVDAEITALIGTPAGQAILATSDTPLLIAPPPQVLTT